MDRRAPGRRARGRIEQRVVVGAGAALDHADKDEVVCGIDPEPGTAAPSQKKVPLPSGRLASGGLKTTAQSYP